jgi:hypothetical protein
MTETYKLAAKPFLLPEGPFKGKLKGVTFRVTSSTNTKQWFSINCGQFGDCFAKLTPHVPAKEIVAALSNGDDVEFPGIYQEEQFNRGFVYELSPVRFEPSPSYLPVL